MFHKPSSLRFGFTLIELLVVISIIGMLSSVVLVSLNGARVKAVNARIIQETGQLRTSLELARTNAGYVGVSSSGGNGVVAYGSLSVGLQTLVNSILKQQGTTNPVGYANDSGASCSSEITMSSNPGVVITTNGANCEATPTEYAIYTAKMPKGSAGYTCVDSRGRIDSPTTGGIILNPSAGACSGTVGGSGGGGGAPVVGIKINNVSYTTGAVVNLPYAEDFDLEWFSTGADYCTYGDTAGGPNSYFSGNESVNGSSSVDTRPYFTAGNYLSVVCTNTALGLQGIIDVQVNVAE